MAKKITAYAKLRVLHLGLDPAAAPWAAALIRAMSGQKYSFVEHHAPGASDEHASRLQLYRPEIPLNAGLSPGKLSRLARAMRGHELILTYGEAGFPAAMAHSLFGQSLGLAPLVHYHDRLNGFAGGTVAKFRYRLGFSRTPAVIAATPAAANEIAKEWGVDAARLRIAVPPFPPAPAEARRDAIPQMLKRKGECWIGVRASDLLGEPEPVLRRLRDLPDNWQIAAFGNKDDTARIAAICSDLNVDDRLLTSQKLEGPEDRAGIFDMILLPEPPRRGAPMPRAPFLAASAGVPIIAQGNVLAPLLPKEQAEALVTDGGAAALGAKMVELAKDDTARARIGKANATFAAARSNAAEHRALFADLTGDTRLKD